jgi:hypothetical protein
VLFGKDAPRLEPVSAVFVIVKLDPELLQSLPNNRFTDAVFIGNLSHGV